LYFWGSNIDPYMDKKKLAKEIEVWEKTRGEWLEEFNYAGGRKLPGTEELRTHRTEQAMMIKKGESSISQGEAKKTFPKKPEGDETSRDVGEIDHGESNGVNLVLQPGRRIWGGGGGRAGAKEYGGLR